MPHCNNRAEQAGDSLSSLVRNATLDDNRCMATEMKGGDDLSDHSPTDELANSLTHGAGILLSLVAGVAIILAAQESSKSVQIAVVAYVASLVAVYTFSTLSHAVQSPEARDRFRAWDQGTIYFLIVGTYTPFAAFFLPNPLFIWVTTAMWVAAVTGFGLKVMWRHRVNAVTTWSYIALGWFPAMAFIGRVPFGCMAWMAIGGIFYTAGTLFLMADHRARLFHAVWHILVIVASACHYYAVLIYVLA
jgi:hemolysin III